MYDIACLRQKIEASFDMEELHTLCFDLGANYHAISGNGIGAKSRELVRHFQYRNRLDDLFEACQTKRPLVKWNDCIRQPAIKSTPLLAVSEENEKRLEQIKGIGSVFCKRLQEAGIITWAQLAALSEVELTQILQVNGRAAAILTEVNHLLNPPAVNLPRLLQKVKGIGPHYAQKLYRAEVETIEELVALNPTDLKDILEIRSNKRVDALLIEATKMILACQRKGKHLPLEKVSGIGPVFAQRLCRAGIDTIEELLWLDAEKLAEILSIGLERSSAILNAAEQFDKPIR